MKVHHTLYGRTPLPPFKYYLQTSRLGGGHERKKGAAVGKELKMGFAWLQNTGSISMDGQDDRVFKRLNDFMELPSPPPSKNPLFQVIRDQWQIDYT